MPRQERRPYFAYLGMRRSTSPREDRVLPFGFKRKLFFPTQGSRMLPYALLVSAFSSSETKSLNCGAAFVDSAILLSILMNGCSYVCLVS